MSNYNASGITVLEGLEAVRRRPGMYIGDTQQAIMQMILEVLDNSIDEYIMGYGNKIQIKINNDEVVIRDYGRGIPVDQHESGKTGLEVIMTVLHAGGKFDANSYKYSGGLHGVGVSVVNALSEVLVAQVHRNGLIYEMEFNYGDVKTPLHTVGTTVECGTEIKFKPDYSIVENNWPTFEDLIDKLQQISYLNKGLQVDLDYFGKVQTFFSDGGIKSYVESLSKSKITQTISMHSAQVDVAFFWEDNDQENIIGFTNRIKQVDGGTHVTGFKTIINKVINQYLLQNKNTIKPKVPIENEDIRVGLYGIISVRIQEPSFSSQTKGKLISIEGKTLVENTISQEFTDFLEKNPEQAKLIVNKIMLSAIKRDASQKAKDVAKKEVINSFNCFGKLSDCQTNDPTVAELFLVEGDGAGGSARSGRDRRFQAILPLKGKLLNVERSTPNKILNCQEITTLIASLGCGIGKNFNIDNLKYHKIIIMTDADIDGAHIRALIIMFFIKMMPDVVKSGYLYVVRPPLFKVTFGKNSQYLQDEIELSDYLFNRFIANNSVCFSGSDKPIDNNSLRDFIFQINDIVRFVNRDTKVANKNILMICLTYGLFHDIDCKYLNNIFNGETSIVKTENELKISVVSIYGRQTYVLDSVRKNDWKMKEFPVVLNGKIIYNPFEFLEEFKALCNRGLYIQRYKGLGEMNADELTETSLNLTKRQLVRLTIPEGTEEEVITNIKNIMGNEIERRSFVLQNIQDLISTNWQ